MSVARHLGKNRKEKSPETAISRDFGAFYSYHQSMERVMGIEPTWPAWEAGALPLSYTRERKLL